MLLNLLKIGKQIGKHMTQLLPMISLKGLNRGCNTGMSPNRLNRACEIRTSPNVLGSRQTSETSQTSKVLPRLLTRISLKGLNRGERQECR